MRFLLLLSLSLSILVLSAQPPFQTAIAAEHQLKGPILTQPTIFVFAPSPNGGPSILVPITLDGLTLGTDLVLRVTAPATPAPVATPPILVFAQRLADGSWIANSPRLKPGATFSVRRNGLENYSPIDFTFTIAASQITLRPTEPWDASSTIALWVY